MSTHHETAIDELPEGAAAAIREVRDLTYKATRHDPVDLLDGVKALVVPDAHELVVTDVREPDDWKAGPARRRGTATFEELEPFTRYVNLHSSPTATTVWTHHNPAATGSSRDSIGSLTAILDDHDGATGTAGWGEHRAYLELVTTPEWQHWVRADGVLQGQVDFAEHIEDGVAEIVKPAAAELLDAVQTIQLTRNAVFASQAVRTPTGGLSFTYKEDEDAKAGKRGELEIPERFTLRVAAFPGGNRIELNGRLRYRLVGQQLAIGYRLERPQDALLEAVRDIHKQLHDQLAEELRERVYRGSPVSARRRDADHELRIRRVS